PVPPAGRPSGRQASRGYAATNGPTPPVPGRSPGIRPSPAAALPPSSTQPATSPYSPTKPPPSSISPPAAAFNKHSPRAPTGDSTSIRKNTMIGPAASTAGEGLMAAPPAPRLQAGPGTPAS